MRILLVSEGHHELGSGSERGALGHLVCRLLNRQVEIVCKKVSSPEVRIHRRAGEGGGFRRRSLMWLRYAIGEGFDALVLVVDEDGDRQRCRELEESQQETRLALARAFGVAIRSFDAWMLPDELALSRVLQNDVPRQREPEGLREPKRVCRGLLETSGSELSQTQMYEALAQVVDLLVLEQRCPLGFRPFAQRVRGLRKPV